ncbi:MAG TPA: hypothetical protein VEL28_19860 [Candidatus Binatia bacterium]|nr:hypothetical protein [Candidatus Binatia bacterium]
MVTPQLEWRGAVGTRTWRIAASALLGLSGLSLPFILALVLVASDPPVTPPLLLRLFVALSVLPAIAGHLLLRARTSSISVGASELALRGSGLTIEVPARAIDRIRPWIVPLPGPGFSVQLRSGQWLRYGIVTDDPFAILSVLGRECQCDAAASAARHPLVTWAHARATYGRASPAALFLKFVIFALAPTAVLFNAHQHISFGGLLGQWNIVSPLAWLQTLVEYWLTLIVYLVLYAGVVRGIVELALVAVSWIRAAAAHGARRAGEVACQVLYYAGVPALVGLRFLDW